MKSEFFAEVLKNNDFSRHFQFHHNIVEYACKLTLKKSNQIVQWTIRQTVHFNKARMWMSAFFRDIFQQNFKVQESVFMKYIIVI